VRALKVFVILGGIVLLAGSALLLVLIVLRGTGTEEPPGLAATGLAAPPLCELALPAPGTAMGVPLPAGARIEQVVPSGGCLILLGVDGDGRQFVALVDPYSGARLSLLLMQPQE
jgi:hypothetical protein